MPLGLLPVLLFLSSSAALEACTWGTPGAKNSLKLAECLAGSGLFPVSQSHKLIQNFLQSLEPPLLVGGCSCVSPVHMRAVRFTNLGYFFPKFLRFIRLCLCRDWCRSVSGSSCHVKSLASFPTRAWVSRSLTFPGLLLI